MTSSRGGSAAKVRPESCNNGKISPSPMDLSMSDVQVTGERKTSFDDPDLTRCDFSCVAPSFCQKFRKRWLVLFWLSWCAFTQSMLVNGFVNSVVTTLERRYGLRSSESGAIASFYDVGVTIMLVPVSFYAAKMRRLRVFSIGMLVLAFGSFLFVVPHLTSGRYQYKTPLEPICYRGQSVNYSTICDTANANAGLNSYKWVFWLAHLLVGVGASPLYTISVSYMDDNLSTQSSALYLGIFYCFSVLGPAVGYLGASFFLGIYVDIGVPHPGLSVLNTQVWVGAWWLSFVVATIIALCAVIPLYGFPKELPGTARIRAQKKSEAFGASESSGTGVDIRTKDILKNFKIVLCNPTFIFISLSGFAESIVTSGVSTFGPKYIETVFGFSAGEAARIFGFTLVPMGGGGMVIGGIIIRCLKLSLVQILRLQAVMAVIPLPFILSFLIPCGQTGGTPGWAGITTSYTNGSNQLVLNSTCNAGCQCRPVGVLFSPICGADQLTYFSPCYAGCEGSLTTGFHNCSCISAASKAASGVQEVVSGACSMNCKNLIFFMIPFAASILFTFMISTPGITSTMRCVPEKQKSLALGIQWLIIRILGSIPGPVIMGAAFDTTCLYWSSSCGADGSCSLYSGDKLRRLLLIIGFSAKGFSTICLFLAWLLYKPSTTFTPEEPPKVDNGAPNTADGHDNPAMDRTEL